MDFQEIIAGTVGKENTCGARVGRVKAGQMTFARLSTDDIAEVVRGYSGEGAFTNDPLNTFGGAGVVEIPGLQNLLHYICENGFEHHVAANFSTVATLLRFGKADTSSDFADVLPKLIQIARSGRVLESGNSGS